MSIDDHERSMIHQEFADGVNMTASKIEKFLDTDESRSVGQKSEAGGESVGHESGRKIVAILRTKKSDLSESDYQHMRKVNGYLARHLAQRPEGDIKQTPWRYSLMNWGHDPLE